MRYRAYFLSASDEAIRSAPRAITVNVKKKYINFEFMQKVPVERIQSLEMEFESSDKAFSVAKAGVGLLIAGPLGLVGGALGGKKTKSILTIKYINDTCNNVEVKLEGASTAIIKNKYEKYKLSSVDGSNDKSTASSIKNTLYWGSTIGIWVAAFRLYIRFYKWFFRGFKAIKK